MARLYGNENFPLPVVERLRELGHGVTTVADTGNAAPADLTGQLIRVTRPPK